MKLTVIENGKANKVEDVETFHRTTSGIVIVEFKDGTEAEFEELVRGFSEQH